MATFTVTTDSNFQDSAFSSRAGNDVYNINGATVTIDTDTRYCTNATATTGNLGNVTISSTLGGKLLIDGTSVRLIPYNSGSGNVPAIGTSITEGGVSAYLLGVWDSFTVAPTAAGAAMPADGYIKVKNKTGGSYSAGALGGIGASATGADVVGWIEVVGVESSTLSVPRLGTVEFNGDWFAVGTTSGAANQTIQMPASLANTYYPGVWIETAASSGVYEFYPNAGTATTTRTDVAGKVVWISSQGLLRIGNSGAATNGFTPASGLNIRVPNIITINVTSAAMNVNAVPNATMTTRVEFAAVSGSGGVVDIDKANIAWYLNCAQFFSLQLTNTGVFEQITIAELVSPVAWDQVGIGQTAALTGTTPLTMTLCFAGGTFNNCNFSRATFGNGTYCVSMADCFGFNFTNTVNRTMAARSSTTAGAYTLTRVKDGSWTNLDVVGAKAGLLVTCENLSFSNISYCDVVSSTTGTGTGQYVMAITADSSNITVDGFDFWGLTNVQPYTGLFNIITGSGNIKIRNAGTAASPLSLGSANQTGYVTVGAAGAGIQNVELKRVYLANTRTGFTSNMDNSHNKVTFQNVWVDAADSLVFTALNVTAKGMRGVNTTTGQASVYGVHWFDLFDSGTTGRIGIAANEKTTVEPSASSYTVDTASTYFGFTSTGFVQMPKANDQVTWTCPYTIIGHKTFTVAAPTITNIAALTVTAGSWASNTTTLTCGTHGLDVGDVVSVTGVTPAAYNGTFTITSTPSATQIAYTQTSNPGTWSSGGDILQLDRLDFFYALNQGAGYGAYRNLKYTRTGGVTTNTTTTISMTDTTGVEVGDYVTSKVAGAGASTRVTSIDSGTAVTVNVASSATTAENVLYFNHLPFETITSAEDGFNLKVRVKSNGNMATAAFSYITIPTTTDATALAYQYPLDTYDVVLQNIVVGSRYDIYNTTTSESLTQGTAATTTVTVSVPATVNDVLRVRVRYSATQALRYLPFETNATVTTTGASVYISQVEDTIAE